MLVILDLGDRSAVGVLRRSQYSERRICAPSSDTRTAAPCKPKPLPCCLESSETRQRGFRYTGTRSGVRSFFCSRRPLESTDDVSWETTTTRSSIRCRAPSARLPRRRRLPPRRATMDRSSLLAEIDFDDPEPVRSSFREETDESMNPKPNLRSSFREKTGTDG